MPSATLSKRARLRPQLINEACQLVAREQRRQTSKSPGVKKGLIRDTKRPASADSSMAFFRRRQEPHTSSPGMHKHTIGPKHGFCHPRLRGRSSGSIAGARLSGEGVRGIRGVDRVFGLHPRRPIAGNERARAQMYTSCTTGLLRGWTGKRVESLHASCTRHLWAIM